MIKLIVESILLGLLLSFLFGPAFFSLLQTSIHRGFKYGIMLALGIFLSDVFIVGLYVVGATSILKAIETHKTIVGTIGAAVLIGFGIYTMMHKLQVDSEDENGYNNPPRKLYTYIIKGFLMNITNPFVFIYWLTWTGAISSQFSNDKYKIITFFLITLFTVLSFDIMKSFVANKIKKWLNPKIMLWINRIIGVLLIIFGIVLFVEVMDFINYFNI